MVSRKWVLRVLCGVIGSVAVYALYVVANREIIRRHGIGELTVAFAETDAIDPNWRWEKVNAARKRPPDDQNSAILIPKIKQLTAPEWGKTRDDAHSASLPDPAPNVRYPAGVINDARRDLTASDEAVKLARSVKALGHGHREIVLAPNPIATNIEDTQSTRHAADLLKWDVTVAAEDDDYGRIGDDLAAALNVSRSVGDEPFMISQLVRIGTRSVMVRSLERAIAQTGKADSLKALRLAELQEALADDVATPQLLYGIRGERAMFEVLFEKMDDGTLDMVEAPIGRAPREDRKFDLAQWLYRARVPADRAFALRWMNQALEAAQKPIHEQRTAFEALPDLPDDGKHILSRMLLPMVYKVAVASWRNIAEARCAVVGIACERYRLKNGRWPKTLAELQPEYLSVIPLDPFDGEQLRYKKLEDGILIHSVGPMGKPPASLSPVDEFVQKHDKVRPGLPDGVKLGFRLWNPEARRQPAPAEPKDDEKP
jgi:hypothetical protein